MCMCALMAQLCFFAALFARIAMLLVECFGVFLHHVGETPGEPEQRIHCQMSGHTNRIWTQTM